MTSAGAAHSWLARPPRSAAGSLRLFCLPYAGMGASLFREWPAALPPGIEVWRVRLPGRESRFSEPAFAAMEPVVAALAPAVAAAADRPYAIYGHSMGALVAFELARRLRALGAPPPAGLAVGAMRAPHLPDRYPPLYTLSPEDFRDELRRRYGFLNTALDHPELYQTMLPTLRADSQVCDTYAFRPEAPLGCPIAAYGGREDAHVTEQEIRGWREQTTASFHGEMLPADHFFVASARDLFLPRLARWLADLA